MASPKSSDNREVHSTSEEITGEQTPDKTVEFSKLLGSILQFGVSKCERLNYVPSLNGSEAFTTATNPCCPGSNIALSFSNSIANPTYQYQPMMVSLEDKENLWSQFSEEGTEMIIARNGRLMFPTVKLKFENLCPYTYYKVFLEFVPVDSIRYKFEGDKWVPKLTEKMKPPEWLRHPMSPALGQKWMEKPIDFNVKLTNSLDIINEGMACLSSMHKYMIKIHVIEGTDATLRDPLRTRTFPLTNTTFMAVTTYQNPKIKELKTEKNIHAKGIRHKKMRLCHGDHEDMKENNTEWPKIHQPDVPFNHNVHPLVSRNDSIIPAVQCHDKPESTSSSACTSSSSDRIPFWQTDDKQGPRTIPSPTPYKTSASYPYNIPPFPHPFDIRIPLPAPLTVHCPTPHYIDPTPFYPYSSVQHQAFPFHPSLPSSSIAFQNWQICPNTCPSFNCSSSSCNTPALRVCPGYRMPYSLKPCTSLCLSDNVPSSTSEMEQPSTSSESSCLPISSDNPLPRPFSREYRDDSMYVSTSSSSAIDGSPKIIECTSSTADINKLCNTLTEDDYSVTIQN